MNMSIGVVFDVEFIFGVRLSLSTLKRVFFGPKSMNHCYFLFDWEWIRDGCAVAKLTCGVRKRDVMFGAFSSRAFESHIFCRFAHCRKNNHCQPGAQKKQCIPGSKTSFQNMHPGVQSPYVVSRSEKRSPWIKECQKLKPNMGRNFVRWKYSVRLLCWLLLSAF